MSRLVVDVHIDTAKNFSIKRIRYFYIDEEQYIAILCDINGLVIYRIETFFYGKVKFHYIDSYKFDCFVISDFEFLVPFYKSAWCISFVFGLIDGRISLMYNPMQTPHSTQISSVQLVYKESFIVLLSSDIESNLVVSKVTEAISVTPLYIFSLNLCAIGSVVENILSDSQHIKLLFYSIGFQAAYYGIVSSQRLANEDILQQPYNFNLATLVRSYDTHLFFFQAIIPEKSKIRYLKAAKVYEDYFILIGLSIVEVICSRNYTILKSVEVEFKVWNIFGININSPKLYTIIEPNKHIVYSLEASSKLVELVMEYSGIEIKLKDSQIASIEDSQRLFDIQSLNVVSKLGRFYAWSVENGPPFKIGYLNVTKIGQRFCEVTFTSPPCNGSNILRWHISVYRVKRAIYSSRVICINTDASCSKFSITHDADLSYSIHRTLKVLDLLPGEEFQVALAAENEYGIAPFSPSSSKFFCLCGVPEKISRPKCIPKDSSSIKIHFTVPFNGGAPITCYRVQYKGGVLQSYDDSEVSVEIKGRLGQKQILTLTNLESYTTYNVRIAAVNKMGSAPFSDRSLSVETYPDMRNVR